MTDPDETAQGPGRVVPWAEGRRLVRGLARITAGISGIRWAAGILVLTGIGAPLLFGSIVRSETVVALAVLAPALLSALVGTTLWMAGLRTLCAAVRHPMTIRYLRLARRLVLLPTTGLFALLDPDPERALFCTGLTLALLHPGGYYATLLALRHLARLQGLGKPQEDARSTVKTLALCHVVAVIAVVLGAAAASEGSPWHPAAFIAYTGAVLLILLVIPLGRLGQLAQDIRWAIEVGYAGEVDWQKQKVRRRGRY